MIKQKYYQIIFLFGTFLGTPLYATNCQKPHICNDGELKQENLPLVRYYNYTSQNSKQNIDNTVPADGLKKPQQHLTEHNRITDKLTRKAGAVCFMVIVSDKKTKQLSKFFFINRKPSTEKSAMQNVAKAFGCHVIGRNSGLSPHIIFQILGWLAQEKRRYIPIFIHANAPLCITCHAVVLNLFKLDMPKHTKGCNGTKAVDLEKVCPLAQKYINSGLTLSLAKKILLPSEQVVAKSKLNLLKSAKDHQKGNHLNKQPNNLAKENNSLKSAKLLLEGRLKNRDIYVKMVEKSKDALQQKHAQLQVERDILDKELLDKIDRLYSERDALSKKLAQIADLLDEASSKPYLYPHSSCISSTEVKKIMDEKQ